MGSDAYGLETLVAAIRAKAFDIQNAVVIDIWFLFDVLAVSPEHVCAAVT
jgi:hypothetical protein